MLKTKTVTSKSPVPIYIGAGAFVVISLIFPMIKMSTIFIGLAVSFVLIAVLRIMKVFPDITETVTYDEPEFFANKTVEELVLEGRKMKNQMNSLNDKIQDVQVSSLIDSIQKTHQAILDYVQTHPDSSQTIRKYMKYYVPSILELLNHFDELEATQFSGMNAELSRKRITELLVTADAAFKKQLDSLMDQQALDISVEARVLEDLMSREGLVEKK
ncbi:MAG: 5-bromo-4-chloroindolyl phosphate hydrolysis family protein [Erysipelotrichaceae bacterium]|nr:5-bromo-4-chloroindolyl phosphate hydrolysis family protein [Erysipelotrichaceae bacterium]